MSNTNLQIQGSEQNGTFVQFLSYWILPPKMTFELYDIMNHIYDTEYMCKTLCREEQLEKLSSDSIDALIILVFGQLWSPTACD